MVVRRSSSLVSSLPTFYQKKHPFYTCENSLKRFKWRMRRTRFMDYLRCVKALFTASTSTICS